MDREGRTCGIVDARRDDGARFAARADERLTAFLELESVMRPGQRRTQLVTKQVLATQFAPQRSQAEQSAAEQRNCRAAIRDRRRDAHRPDLGQRSGVHGAKCINDGSPFIHHFVIVVWRAKGAEFHRVKYWE